jgi:DNA-binding NarL/FixJ family response regulator
MLKILIADDHPIVRKGLKQILEDNPEKIQTHEAEDGREAVEKALREQYDLVVMDIAMPHTNGLDALKELRSAKPHMPILMLSMYPEEQYAVRAFKAGASGYLTKQNAPEELLQAISRVLSGRKYVSTAMAEKLAGDLSTDAEGPRHEKLSDREFQVLCLIASGRSVSEIADKLFLSVKTVSTYRTRILIKMGMKHNAELTYYAVKNALVD